ncbi:MAG: hypothetical protein ISS19_13050 [Bacteroidales bacterium]|nr:hypothetical protein [Bacteroidales bacterium]
MFVFVIIVPILVPDYKQFDANLSEYNKLVLALVLAKRPGIVVVDM